MASLSRECLLLCVEPRHVTVAGRASFGTAQAGFETFALPFLDPYRAGEMPADANAKASAVLQDQSRQRAGRPAGVSGMVPASYRFMTPMKPAIGSRWPMTAGR